MNKVLFAAFALAATIVATKLSKAAASETAPPKFTPPPTSVKREVIKFKIVPKTTSENWELKTAIDAWLARESAEVNMYGDARGTKYQYGDSPLVDAKGERANDKYDYIAHAHRDSKPWEIKYPKHWGKEPMMQTRDYVKLPNDYGFGSSTLARWIEENMAKDAAAAALKAVGGK